MEKASEMSQNVIQISQVRIFYFDLLFKHFNCERMGDCLLESVESFA
jgi:hypothetical protein